MKDSLFLNGKSTVKDELLLHRFIVICIEVCLLFYSFAPECWITSNSTIKVFGIVWMLAGVMCIPGFIYRLFSKGA